MENKLWHYRGLVKTLSGSPNDQGYLLVVVRHPIKIAAESMVFEAMTNLKVSPIELPVIEEIPTILSGLGAEEEETYASAERHGSASLLRPFQQGD